MKKALFTIRIGGNPHEYPFSAALYNLSKVLPKTSSLNSSAFNPSLINIAAGHLLAWVHANDPIDFVSQADFLAHRGYYARVVKDFTGIIGIIEWGEQIRRHHIWYTC